MDHLQEDIEALESEKTTLKTKLEQASKRAPRAHLTESILAEQASGQPGSVKVIVEDSPATLSKLESLQVRVFGIFEFLGMLLVITGTCFTY